jgi:hypothetical protein
LRRRLTAGNPDLDAHVSAIPDARADDVGGDESGAERFGLEELVEQAPRVATALAVPRDDAE